MHLGELLAARRVLISDGLADGNDETLRLLNQRPQHAYGELDPRIIDFQPPTQFSLDRSKLIANVRRARRGAAAGPNGCTAEHFNILLDDEICTELFAEASERLAT